MTILAGRQTGPPDVKNGSNRADSRLMSTPTPPRGVFARSCLFAAINLGTNVAFILVGLSMFVLGSNPLPALMAAQILWLAAMAYCNTLVGYRIRDIGFSFIPFVSYWYTWKIVWRLTSLPHRYWEEDYRPPQNHFVAENEDSMRIATYQAGLQYGLTSTVSGIASVAMFPLESVHKPRKDFEDLILHKRTAFTSRIRNARDQNTVADVAISALREYAWLAAQYGERYYADRFNEVLEHTEQPDAGPPQQRFGVSPEERPDLPSYAPPQ